jgi:hypothetical protein
MALLAGVTCNRWHKGQSDAAQGLVNVKLQQHWKNQFFREIHIVSALGGQIRLPHQNLLPNDTTCKEQLFPYTAFTVLPL